jgi:hypothetical protein
MKTEINQLEYERGLDRFRALNRRRLKLGDLKRTFDNLFVFVVLLVAIVILGPFGRGEKNDIFGVILAMFVMFGFLHSFTLGQRYIDMKWKLLEKEIANRWGNQVLAKALEEWIWP